MTSSTSIPSALTVLDQAVQQLEAAVARRNSRDETLKDAETELTLMRTDRARLADELDAAISRGNALDSARADVAGRLEKAIATIRDTLGNAGSGNATSGNSTLGKT